MSTKLASERYLIQIDLGNAGTETRARVDLDTVQRVLAGTGIELDSSYAPVCINLQQQRFVVRGLATMAARLRAEKKLGSDVKFFSDGRVQPMRAGGKNS